MSHSYQDMAAREAQAAERMIESLMALGELDQAQAVHVFNLYLKHRLFNTRHVHHGGDYEVKHGAYLDQAVLQRAATLDTL